MKTLIAALATAAALATTVSASATPAPYPYPPYPYPVRTPEMCADYAEAYADYVVGDRGRHALIGGLIGAGFGAFFGGAIAGAPGIGAVVGAGAGAGLGYLYDSPEWEAQFNWAYQTCIYGYPLSYPWAMY